MRSRRRSTCACVLALIVVLASGCSPDAKPAAVRESTLAQTVDTTARQPCDSAATQLAMTTCWTTAAAHAETLETAQFTKAMAVVKQKGTAAQSDAFAAAEEKWKGYRDAQCQADASFYAGGSAAATAAAVCRTRHANDRGSTVERIYRDWAAR